MSETNHLAGKKTSRTAWFLNLCFFDFCFPATHEGVLIGGTVLPRNQDAARKGSIHNFGSNCPARAMPAYGLNFPLLSISLDDPTPS